MSLTIQVPPAMEQEVVEYAQMRGTTVENLLFESLKREMAERAMRRS